MTLTIHTQGLVAVALGTLMATHASLIVLLASDDIPTPWWAYALNAVGVVWWSLGLYHIGAGV